MDEIIDEKIEVEDETQKSIRTSREALEYTYRVFSLTCRGIEASSLQARTSALEEAVEKSA